jgi:hypothetical protein
MNVHSFFSRFRYFFIPCRAALMLVALAWSTVTFGSAIHEAAGQGDLEKIKALLKSNSDLDERETPRLCRGGSQSLTAPGITLRNCRRYMRVMDHGNNERLTGKAQEVDCPRVLCSCDLPGTGREGDEGRQGLPLPPEGPCGFKPLHLRQASGFAGGR